MADLGAIAKGDVTASFAYLPTTSGLGKIAGVVKQNGLDLFGEVTLIDEALNMRVYVAIASSFNFKGLNPNRTYTLVARNLASTQYSPLAYDRIKPVAL
jgi:hypothetical protein